MKTLLAIVLCFCVGCGVSEQEKLAKRLNDKMDREEEVNRTFKIRWKQAEEDLRADLKKKRPLIFNDEND